MSLLSAATLSVHWCMLECNFEADPVVSQQPKKFQSHGSFLIFFSRYLDAAKIRDQIFDWELKFFLWRIEEKKELQKRLGSLDGGRNNLNDSSNSG